MDSKEIEFAGHHHMYEVAATLKAAYLDYDHNNKKNPLDELLYIVCSVKTTSRFNEATYKSLRREFPRYKMIAEAPVEYIAAPLAPGGFQTWKAKTIKGIMDKIKNRFGKPTLAPLKHMSDEECEAFLISLPGVGKKVARCVMMYSLDRSVFPVDTNCWRICIRLGWIEPTQKDGKPSQKDMDRLQKIIPPELRYSLHVNMVSLGRDVCLPKKPKCNACSIRQYCQRVGLEDSV